MSLRFGYPLKRNAPSKKNSREITYAMLSDVFSFVKILKFLKDLIFMAEILVKHSPKYWRNFCCRNTTYHTEEIKARDL